MHSDMLSYKPTSKIGSSRTQLSLTEEEKHNWFKSCSLTLIDKLSLVYCLFFR